MTAQQQMQKEPTVMNGVNVTALFETIEAVQQTPEIADFQFRTSNRWMGGDHNRSTIRGFKGACEEHAHTKGPFEVDNAEPPVLLGEGEAANPVEYVLHALAGCLTTTMVYHAAARGIEIDERVGADFSSRPRLPSQIFRRPPGNQLISGLMARIAERRRPKKHTIISALKTPE